jgi:hypothetical protein
MLIFLYEVPPFTPLSLHVSITSLIIAICSFVYFVVHVAGISNLDGNLVTQMLSFGVKDLHLRLIRNSVSNKLFQIFSGSFFPKSFTWFKWCRFLVAIYAYLCRFFLSVLRCNLCRSGVVRFDLVLLVFVVRECRMCQGWRFVSAVGNLSSRSRAVVSALLIIMFIFTHQNYRPKYKYLSLCSFSFF